MFLYFLRSVISRLREYDLIRGIVFKPDVCFIGLFILKNNYIYQVFKYLIDNIINYIINNQRVNTK